MYHAILIIHSWLRWLVLASLLYALFRSYRGLFARREFSALDNTVRHTTATIAHIQLIIGVWLYLISPVVSYFFQHYKDAVHQRQIRFFGMEHSTMMLIAITLISIDSASGRRKPTDKQKFKTKAIWFSIALLVILSSVPWPFSPFTARPFFRTT